MMNTLSVLTVNCCGLNAPVKRAVFFKWLQSLSVDCFLVSETHCATADAASQWSAEWLKGASLAAFSLSSSSHTGGSAILLHPRVTRRECSHSFATHSAFNGALTTASIVLDGASYTLAAVYAPVAAHARLSFLDSLLSFPFPADGQLIFAGDFNCVEAPERDYRGLYPTYHLQQPGGDKLAELCAQRQLVDGWISCFGSGGPPPFTRYTGSAHSDGASRIDRIYLDAALAQSITSANVISAPFTDHEAVEIRLGSVSPPRAQWRLNDSLLQSPTFCKHIRLAWLQWSNDAEDRPLATRWLGFKSHVRAIAIEHAEAANRERRALTRRIVPRSPSARRRVKRLIQLGAQTRLVQDRDADLRARALGDRPTKQFFGRVPKHPPPRPITSLSSDSGTLAAPADITAELQRFWGEVFGSVDGPVDPTPQTALHAAAQLASLSRLNRSITSAQAAHLATDYSLEELKAACYRLRVASAPGPDGLSVAFYRMFWDLIGPVLRALLVAVRFGDRLPEDSLQASVILLPKSSSACPTAGDFRPISLLNVDYKVWATSIAARVNPLLPGLCRPTQTGFVPGRQIMQNVTFNRDIAQWARQTGSPLVFALLDFEKAFDRVNWAYLYSVLAQMRFPASLIADIRSLYSGFHSRLMLSGEHQVAFRPSRGVRQGCPLSPALFALFAEPLGALIDAMGVGTASAPPTGVLLPSVGHRPPLRIAGSQYADDTTVYAPSIELCSSVLVAIESEFCVASGAKLNSTKTRLLLFNVQPPLSCPYRVLSGTDSAKSLGALYGDEREDQADFDLILTKMRCRLCTWLRLYPSLLGRALVANTIISSCLWFFCFFAVPSPGQLQLMDATVRAALWNKASSPEVARGLVSIGRLTAPRQKGGLGVILPSVMIKALRTRMVNQALLSRSLWWSHLFDWFIERGSLGLASGVDGLAIPRFRKTIGINCPDSYWSRAVQDWSDLDYACSSPSWAPPQHGLAFPIVAHCWSRPQFTFQQSVFEAFASSQVQTVLDVFRPDRLSMRDQDSITNKTARVTTVSLRRLNNGFHTVAQLVESLPELSRLREAHAALPSSLWAFHHDPSRVVALTPPNPLSLSTPSLAAHARCECRHRLDGSRGLPIAWRRVLTPVYGVDTV